MAYVTNLWPTLESFRGFLKQNLSRLQATGVVRRRGERDLLIDPSMLEGEAAQHAGVGQRKGKVRRT
jgi:hypothetical protein